MACTQPVVSSGWVLPQVFPRCLGNRKRMRAQFLGGGSLIDRFLERLPVLYARTLRMFARLRLSRCYQTLEGREDRVEYLRLLWSTN